MATLLKPPRPFEETEEFSIFLAGSIEQGKATDWQIQVYQGLKDLPCTLLNPRRDNWDPSWDQSPTNPQFRGQVEWELRGQEMVDLIAMYFDPATKSPITLLELGLFCKDKDMIVCCSPEFWRYGNVAIVCERWGVRLVPTLADLIAALRREVQSGQ